MPWLKIQEMISTVWLFVHVLSCFRLEDALDECTQWTAGGSGSDMQGLQRDPRTRSRAPRRARLRKGMPTSVHSKTNTIQSSSSTSVAYFGVYCCVVASIQELKNQFISLHMSIQQKRRDLVADKKRTSHPVMKKSNSSNGIHPVGTVSCL